MAAPCTACQSADGVGEVVSHRVVYPAADGLAGAGARAGLLLNGTRRSASPYDSALSGCVIHRRDDAQNFASGHLRGLGKKREKVVPKRATETCGRYITESGKQRRLRDCHRRGSPRRIGDIPPVSRAPPNSKLSSDINDLRVADRVGFEPTIRSRVYALSRRAPSTARPPVPRRWS